MAYPPLVSAMFRKMLEDDRRRAGWSVGQAAWSLGVSIHEYRELEAGARPPTFETWNLAERPCRYPSAAREVPQLGGVEEALDQVTTCVPSSTSYIREPSRSPD